MRTRTFHGLVLWLCVLLLRPADGQTPGSPPRPAAAIPFIDLHVHLEAADPDQAVRSAIAAMAKENAVRIVVMPPPFAEESAQRYDAEVLLRASRGYPDRLSVFGGGGTLNPMILEAVRTGDSGPDVQRRFKARAQDLLRLGIAGFGEMAAEHLKGATPYQWAPPDHPLFLLLADLAAERGVPIVLHMEAVPRDTVLPPDLKSPPNPPRLRANIAAFERLLAHNRKARIVWAHAGWDNTGARTVELCRDLLRANANLYMDLKIDPVRPGLNTLLANGASGPIRPEWLGLLKEFPDRFVIGTDQHYPEPHGDDQRWHAAVGLLNQLPDDLQRRIAIENPRRLLAAGGGARL